MENRPHTASCNSTMNDILTIDQQQNYIKDNGNHCPTCNSYDQLERLRLTDNGNNIAVDVICHSCNSSWTELHILTYITDFKNNKLLTSINNAVSITPP